MCLQTTWDAPKIAKEKITVYKSLYDLGKGRAQSIYYTKKYRLGTLYSTEMKIEKTGNPFDVISGQEIKNYDEQFLLNVSNGFHSTLKPERLRDEIEYPNALYRCTIPKGALYFIGLSGLIVSNKIIINEKLTKNETK